LADDSRSPARVADIDPAAPSGLLPFGDEHARSAARLALNSSTPTPSDGKLQIAEQKPAPQKAAATTQAAATAPQTPAVAAQVTVATQLAPGAKPDYASLIDPKDSARQMRCLGEAIYFESRSEPEAARRRSLRWCSIRAQRHLPDQRLRRRLPGPKSSVRLSFSFACEGKSLRIEEPAAWATATRIAQAVVTGANYNPKVVEALNYHANYVYPFWAPSLRRVDRIGAHIFYAMRVGMNWAPGALNGRGDLPPLQPQASARRSSRPSRRRRSCPDSLAVCRT